MELVRARYKWSVGISLVLLKNLPADDAAYAAVVTDRGCWGEVLITEQIWF